MIWQLINKTKLNEKIHRNTEEPKRKNKIRSYITDLRDFLILIPEKNSSRFNFLCIIATAIDTVRFATGPSEFRFGLT